MSNKSKKKYVKGGREDESTLLVEYDIGIVDILY